MHGSRDVRDDADHRMAICCVDVSRDGGLVEEQPEVLAADTKRVVSRHLWLVLVGQRHLALYPNDVVSPSELSWPDSVVVYYIGVPDGDVYKRGLADSEAEKVYPLRSKNQNNRLFVRPNKSDTNHWDIAARPEKEDGTDSQYVDILTNQLVEAAPDWRSTVTDPPQYSGTWMNFGRVPSLGNATNSHWEFRAGYWAFEGLRAWETRTNGLVRFSYETPFGAWVVRNAVHLPSDKVLFQLGDDQICVFDPATRKVALLWRGRGPVAVIEKTDSENDGEAAGITQARED